MKTTRSKKTEKSSVEIPETEKVLKKGRAKRVEYKPTEEEIRLKAEEIYHQRVDRGECGTSEGDWHAAEEYFRNLQVHAA